MGYVLNERKQIFFGYLELLKFKLLINTTKEERERKKKIEI